MPVSIALVTAMIAAGVLVFVDRLGHRPGPLPDLHRGALTSRSDFTGATLRSYSRSYALVIGIDAYTGSGWRPLRNAVKDAGAVRDVLSTHGFEVTLIENPKSIELEPALRDFFIQQGSDPEARLLLWFAGHGHTLAEPIEEGYLVPADAPPATSDADFRRKALAMGQFSYLMTQAHSKHVLAVFDSCFSGTALEIARDAEAELIHTQGRARQIISSGDATQRVGDDGTFRKLFVDAISGRVTGLGRDGFVTGREIGLYLRRELARLTAGSANPQTPNVGYLNKYGFNRGDIVFKLPSDSAGAVGRQ